MKTAKEKLIQEIEAARKKLNKSIDTKQDYIKILRISKSLDKLMEQYIEAGY